jgi:AcrR family transcriptional regulator
VPGSLTRAASRSAVLTAPGQPGRIVRLAARWVHDGRRLDMQQLADELGISRATLFRQAGSREALLGRALRLLADRTLAVAAARWEAERPPGEFRTPGTGRHLNAIVSRSPGLRRLLDEEPSLALRVLTDPLGPVQPGVVSFVAALVRRDVAELGLVTIAEPDALAYALVRLGESFLYADVLANRKPDVQTANRLQQALIEGIPPLTESGPPGAQRSIVRHIASQYAAMQAPPDRVRTIPPERD